MSTPTTITGTTNGSATLYENIQSDNAVKTVILEFDAYQNASNVEQTIQLPTLFTKKALVLTGNTKRVTPYLNGAPLTNSVRQITGLNAAGGSVNIQDSLASEGVGAITGAFDALGLGTNEASTANDIIFIVGI